VHDVFAAPHSSAGTKVTVSVQYVEIYNEQLVDLLAPAGAVVKLCERGDGVLELMGCSPTPVADEAAALALVEAGNKRRATAATSANKHSSRSHAVVRITVESKPAPREGERALVTSETKHELQRTVKWG
jgi:hypothetical protein